jgi:tetratricopeptide (TPR) repeat protein
MQMLRRPRLRVRRVGDRLRSTWDFDDLDATQARFRQLLSDESTDAGRAEVLTQLARVEGLRSRFDAGHTLLDEAEQTAPERDLVRARVLLERGRLHRSSGDRETALAHFVSAFETALGAPDEFLAVDAAHMAALAASARAEMLAWTNRGVALADASDDPDVAYWLGPLLNNLGWEHYEAGDYDAALEAFRRALEARERDRDNAQAREIARYAVAKTLRVLGRAAEAAPMLEAAVAWAEQEGAPDGWFHEELAEIYAALGRRGEARVHAEHALPLLLRDDPAFADDADRVARLRSIAGDSVRG